MDMASNGSGILCLLYLVGQEIWSPVCLRSLWSFHCLDMAFSSALTYLAVGGWAFALSWWVQGIPFDIIHCGGNFCMALVLFRPLRSLLERLAGRAGLR